jgi:protein-S-isoprenylcysteine O-methyltransferase Ste14
MQSLDTRVPPPAVAAAAAVAMWGISRVTPLLQLPGDWRLAAAASIALAGMGFTVSGMIAFRRARTTINPTTPHKSSVLVDSGVYRITRNPMYVGLACVLVAWAVFLSSPWALLGPLAFVLYIGRFQIGPEERALEKLFGSEYAAYRARVRRWL